MNDEERSDRCPACHLEANDPGSVRGEHLLRSVSRHCTVPDRDLRQIACDSASLVLHLYERACPGDGRPRHAIETARRYVSGRASFDEMAQAYGGAAAASRGDLRVSGDPELIEKWAAAVGDSAMEDAAVSAVRAAVTHAIDAVIEVALADAKRTRSPQVQHAIKRGVRSAVAASSTNVRDVVASVVRRDAGHVAHAAAAAAVEVSVRAVARAAAEAIGEGFVTQELLIDLGGTIDDRTLRVDAHAAVSASRAALEAAAPSLDARVMAAVRAEVEHAVERGIKDVSAAAAEGWDVWDAAKGAVNRIIRVAAEQAEWAGGDAYGIDLLESDHARRLREPAEKAATRAAWPAAEAAARSAAFDDDAVPIAESNLSKHGASAAVRAAGDAATRAAVSAALEVAAMAADAELAAIVRRRVLHSCVRASRAPTSR